MLNDEMLTIDEVADYLKLKPQTIYKWAQAGKIPGAKFGKEWRFRRSLIEEWIDSHISPSGSSKSSNTGPGTRAAAADSRDTGSDPPSKDAPRRKTDSGPSKN